jgi:hypothetical protein
MVAILREYGTERILVNSAADWGRSDPLKTLRTAEAMLNAGFDDADVDRVLWRNPVEFYGQSGRLVLDGLDALDELDPDEALVAVGESYQGSSVRRGESGE